MNTVHYTEHATTFTVGSLCVTWQHVMLNPAVASFGKCFSGWSKINNIFEHVSEISFTLKFKLLSVIV